MNYKKPIIVAVACILLVLLLSLLLRSCPTAPDRPELYEDPNAIYIKTTGSAIQGGDYIAIPGFERLTVSSGSCTIGCNIYNPEKNNCYFVAVVSLEDGGEIFRSGAITVCGYLIQGVVGLLITLGFFYLFNEVLNII